MVTSSDIRRAANIQRQAYAAADANVTYDNAWRPYTGPRYVASRYTGPVGEEWVERFKPSDRFDDPQSRAYRDLLNKELARGPYDTEERRANEARRASVSASQEFDIAQRARDRELMSMGVNPASGAYRGSSARAGLARALMTTGAANTARESVRQAGIADRDRRIQIAGLGRQMAESDRAYQLDVYRAEQSQRQFGASLAIKAWEFYQSQRAGDANRAVDIWRTDLEYLSRDADRRQAARDAARSDLGSLLGALEQASASGAPVGSPGHTVRPRRKVGRPSSGGRSYAPKTSLRPKARPPRKAGGSSSGGYGSSRAPTKSKRPRARPPRNQSVGYVDPGDPRGGW